MSARLQDLPLLHPSLTLHLSDNADTPIISSAPPPPAPPSTTTALASPSSAPAPPAQRRPARSAAISSLNRSALASYSAAQRFGLGNPVRIMVECVSRYNDPDDYQPGQSGGGSGSGGTTGGGGPMVLNTYIPPLPQPLPAALVNGANERQTGELPRAAGLPDGDDGSRQPPLLVAVVVTPDGESQTVADARLAASRLARVGRRLQLTWAKEEGGQV